VEVTWEGQVAPDVTHTNDVNNGSHNRSTIVEWDATVILEIAGVEIGQGTGSLSHEILLSTEKT
jgi:hypothetical protein